MSDEIAAAYLADVRESFRKLQGTAERAAAQVDDAAFFATLDTEANSIALVMKHMAGNLRSRFTDFLTSDGEKSDRDRDAAPSTNEDADSSSDCNAAPPADEDADGNCDTAPSANEDADSSSDCNAASSINCYGNASCHRDTDATQHEHHDLHLPV